LLQSTPMTVKLHLDKTSSRSYGSQMLQSNKIEIARIQIRRTTKCQNLND